MRIGIDCDGVLRDFIPDLINKIKETHPQFADKIKIPNSWDWEQWLPFWTEAETEKYVFEDNVLDFFGPEANPIKEAIEDWNDLRLWADENGHELVLVSAQRENCKELTDAWLQRWGFIFTERNYTQHKWSIDVDVLVDDSPAKLKKFGKRSVVNGIPICMKRTWNTKSQNKYISIDRLSDLKSICFGN